LASAKVERRGSRATEMVELRLVALHPADNLAQAHRASKLAIKHGQELALAGQSARPRIRLVCRCQPIKIIPRHMLQC
jgi:hypothetical protein